MPNFMERVTGGIPWVTPHSSPKPTLMLTNPLLGRLLSLVFMIVAGFALAKAFYIGSFMGIMLALVSLVAGIYFIYTLNRARKEMEKEETV